MAVVECGANARGELARMRAIVRYRSSRWSAGEEFTREVLAGKGGSGNVGGAVAVNNSGGIDTFGSGSHGVLAQSIGAGGGTG